MISQNYAYGTVKGKNNVGGLIGYGRGIDLASNAAIVETVNATQSNVGRVYGSIDSYVSVGACGTDAENKGLATAKVTLNGLQQNLPDNLQHGTNVGNATLKLRATYQGIGWDFSNWIILETESYPYKESQCAPPVFTGDLTSGETVVSGKSINGGTVYITIGNKHYTAETNANLWSVVVDQLHAGDVVKAYAVNDSLGQSYISKQVVQFKGKGTEAEPYEIYTANDLSKSTSYSYYKLMNDIDLTEWINTNSPTTGWIPIGLDGGGSMKQLDGDGHRVTGLWSNTTIDFCGLIANTQNATICNINVYTAEGKKVKGGSNSGVIVGKAVNTTFSNVTVNGSVQGVSYVGGLAGYSRSCQFANCKMSGSVVGTGDYVGGICSGYLSSTLEFCSSTANVTGVDFVGGLTGYSWGDIRKSYANAMVTGNNYVGGISGYSSGRSITECYSAGTVVANNNTACYAGGVVGYNSRSSIADCYCSANVSSGVVDGNVASSDLQQYAGGIAGYSRGSIQRCFASGDIYAVKFGAGIVGYNSDSTAITSHCFAINNRIDVSNETGVALRVIGGIKNNAPTPENNNYALKTMVVSVNNVTQIIYDDLLHGISLTDNVLQQQATYTDQGWDFTDVWGIYEDEGYPYLKAIVEENTPDILMGDVNGDGTVNVADYVNVANYILEQHPDPFVFAAADIDGNNEINVSDLVMVANIALTFEGTIMLNAPTQSATQETNLNMNATATRNNDSTTSVTVDLDNGIALTALQMDISLPQGMTLTSASLTDRADRSHQVEVAELANDNYRLLLASGTSKAFKGNEGALLTLTLSGEPQSTLTLSDIKLASPEGKGYTLNDILLSPVVTVVNELAAKARIYGEAGNIVIESPVNGTALLVLPNGMSQNVKVSAGRNIYHAPATGVVIVRMADKTSKLFF
ncbi:MAG: dockerin type I repeat-containing protein [Muribaculaceae bacterium]|nr:dockerin type I repeat-containing protein [Muribaculaceae bacterium]